MELYPRERPTTQNFLLKQPDELTPANKGGFKVSCVTLNFTIIGKPPVKLPAASH